MQKAILALIPVLLAVFSSCQPREEHKRPNVLMISIDDLNTYVGCMGHESALTPHIDRLASQGVLFTNAHAQAPLCGPSRASVMTGLRPSTTGIYGQINDEDIAKASPATKDLTLLPQYLKDYGYYTMGVGKIFHRHAPQSMLDESGGRVKGFGPKPPEGRNFKWDEKGTSTDWGAYPEKDELMPDYQSAQWAMERLTREYDQPFFMAVGFIRPHVPWYVPQKWMDLYDTSQIKTPPWLPEDFNDMPAIVEKIDDLPMYPTTTWALENHEWKNIVRSYLACVSFVDHYVGEVLNALENSAYADNTIIVLWSDHGYRLGEKGSFSKHCLWQEGTRVPLIYKGPGIKAGIKENAPVELLSLYPTLLDLCGLPAYGKNEGHTLLPLLKGEAANWSHPAITTYGKNNHALVTNRYRFIQYEDGSVELYDHDSDPNEWYNIAKDPDYSDLIGEFRNKLPWINRPWSEYAWYRPNDYFRQASGRDHE